MPDIDETGRGQKRISIRLLLLLFTVLSSPLCCFGTSFVDYLPDALLPAGLGFAMNLFEAETRVENRTDETLYVTPITTTTGHPVVIGQSNSIRQRDIPLQPGHTLVLTYDMADRPLSGVGVCREDNDCRLLVPDGQDLSVDTFEPLPSLESDWLRAIQSHPQHDYGLILFPLSAFVPVALFSGWLILSIRMRSQRGQGGS